MSSDHKGHRVLSVLVDPLMNALTADEQLAVFDVPSAGRKFWRRRQANVSLHIAPNKDAFQPFFSDKIRPCSYPRVL